MEHAHRDHPREACGLFLLRDGEQVYLPCENVANKPEEFFAIEDSILLREMVAGSVLGVFHSHPQGELCPSHADMQSQMALELPFYVCTLSPRNTFMDFWGFGDQLPVPALLTRQFRDGVNDCYSLLRHFIFLDTGRVIGDVPRRPDWWNHNENVIGDHLESLGFQRLKDEEPQRGDGVLFRIRAGVPNHCGVYLGQGLILHHLYGRLSKIDPIALWNKHLEGFYRMKQDASATLDPSPGDPSWPSGGGDRPQD